VRRRLGPGRPSSPAWIDERDALSIHGRLLSLDGGLAGVRDLALLQSALARPQQLYAYSKKADVVDLAAAYTVGIIRNRPFTDGNKRAGFVIGVLFLELNGGKFTATEESALLKPSLAWQQAPWMNPRSSSGCARM
jgi:death-on-curing protein